MLLLVETVGLDEQAPDRNKKTRDANPPKTKNFGDGFIFIALARIRFTYPGGILARMVVLIAEKTLLVGFQTV